MEETAMAIALAGNRFCSVRTEKIMQLCTYVAQASQRPIPSNKPITGSLVFTHESGIHCDGMFKDQQAYEPFSGNLLGRNSEFVMGKHSGTALLRQVLNKMGLQSEQYGNKELLDLVIYHLKESYSTIP